jgi:hypothetical protein
MKKDSRLKPAVKEDNNEKEYFTGSVRSADDMLHICAPSRHPGNHQKRTAAQSTFMALLGAGRKQKS